MTQAALIEGLPSTGPGARWDDAPKRESSMELTSPIPDQYSMDRMARFRDSLARSIRGVGLRQVRFVSGIVLFAYLISHFLNHALGNISMEAPPTRVYLHTL